jgi:hypothetical protein
LAPLSDSRPRYEIHRGIRPVPAGSWCGPCDITPTQSRFECAL